MHSKNICLVLLLFLFLNGCVQPDLPKDYFSNQTSASWDKYEIHAKNVKIYPFRILMSLQLRNTQESYRVNAVMWGNSADNLRMDLMTSFGAGIAKIAQTKEDFLVYELRTNNAYFHYGKRKPLLNLKIPIPFGLPELAALLNGQYSKLFGSEYISKNDFNGIISYTLAKKDIAGTLQLNSAGLPIVWISTDKTWIMTIEYGNIAASYAKKDQKSMSDKAWNPPNSIALLPKKIEIIGPNSQKTILFIKKNQQLSKSFPANSLRLLLPDDVSLRPLK